MNTAVICANLLMTACAALIALRAIGILAGMDRTRRTVSHLRWLLFGLSYLGLALVAIGSAWVIWQDKFHLGDYGWLLTSAGLILFDRRPRRKPYVDPEATQPMGAL